LAREQVKLWARRAFHALVVLCVGDALVEPYLLQTTHHRVTAPVKSPLRIAHLSDLHTGGFGIREKRLLAALDRERPDLIAITGDTIDNGDLEAARPVLAAMHAPLGVFAVAGNWEHWRPVSGDQATLYAAAGARFLRNESVRVRDDLYVIGLDDELSGAPNLRGALHGVPDGAMRLTLFHSPTGFTEAAPHTHLALAGHTHGGQVRVPFLGALWRPPGSGDYDRGFYRRDQASMYVSQGLGTSILRVRFGCRPELAIIDVTP
jgi:predicted MPP superfamily phosphohydrolase